MDAKFAPWRINWVTQDDPNEEIDGCVFCGIPDQGEDIQYRILARGDHSYAVLNNSPYNPGHTMVIPFAHLDTLVDFDPGMLYDTLILVQKSMVAISDTFQPDGFNIGVNIGRAAGASIDDHLHIHLIPRWYGDTTFMPITANTKLVVQALDESYYELRDSFAQIEGVEEQGTDQAASVKTELLLP